MDTVIRPTTPTADNAASCPRPCRGLTTIDPAADVDSLPAPAAEDKADPPSPRLLDSDPSKFRSLKRVIVIGRPGCRIDGIDDALRKLGFKVYDFELASSRYQRDFPLWLEAARLRHEGRSYNKSDFDKLTGDHDAIIGAPACFFDQDLVKLNSGVKAILLGPDSTFKARQKISITKFLRGIDPDYHGNIDRFLKLLTSSDKSACITGVQEICEHVRDNNVLEIRNLVAWIPVCEFLQVEVPDEPAPELHDRKIMAELTARPWRALLEKANTVGRQIAMGMANVLTMASMTLVSALAFLLGGVGLHLLSSAGIHLLHFLAPRSRIRDTTRGVAAGIALFTLICGTGTGYTIARMRIPEPAVAKSSYRDHQRRSENDRRRGGRRGWGRQTDNGENRGPERPTLAEWSGVQESIRKDDAGMVNKSRATFEECKTGKHVTFHVTHKRTETDQDLFSGSRKVLSVTKETVQ